MRDALFNAYVRMMVRLEAEEALSNISQVSAGMGTMPKYDRSRYMSELRSHLPRPRPVRPTIRQLQQMGVEVVISETKDD
jgi:hypothetical protein